eukprot:11211591-Lingulodinium_polyedra.AAC.1
MTPANVQEKRTYTVWFGINAMGFLSFAQPRAYGRTHLKRASVPTSVAFNVRSGMRRRSGCPVLEGRQGATPIEFSFLRTN